MKTKILILILLFSNNLFAQINVIFKNNYNLLAKEVIYKKDVILVDTFIEGEAKVAEYPKLSVMKVVYSDGQTLNSKEITSKQSKKEDIKRLENVIEQYEKVEKELEKKGKILMYKSSNGKVYKIGDTIQLGKGSAQNGDFIWFQIGGWAAYTFYKSNGGSDQWNVTKFAAGTNVIIKKIKTSENRGASSTYFVVDGGNITNYWLFIEQAIQTCEVKDCILPNQQVSVINQSNKPDKYDQLKKIKDLLDSGVLTKEEFETEKTKILKGN